MSLYRFKSCFQKSLQPCCRYLHKRGIKPDHITISAIGLSAMGGILVYHSQYIPVFLWVIPCLLLGRMALNALDGMLARDYHETTQQGELLNEMGDVVSDSIFYLPFAYLMNGIQTEMLIVLVLLGVFSEMLGVLTQNIGASRRYDGPLGKSDRAAFFGLLSILLACGYGSPIVTQLLLACGLILSLLTLKNRTKNALLEVN